jgi:plastocyanin
MILNRIIMKRRVAFLAAVSALIGCAGCSVTPNPLKPDAIQPAATVLMHFHSFDPATVTITAGQTVVWENATGGIYHTVTCDPSKAEKMDDASFPTGASAFDSGDIQSKDSWEYTFTVPGTYKYFCIPHESHGMIGTVIVNPK